MVFDPNQKNVAPMYIGTVHNGAITYRLATMEKTSTRPHAADVQRTPETLAPPQVEAYAHVGEDGVTYNGPHQPDVPAGPVRIVLFGPQAATVAQSVEMQAALAAEDTKGRPWKLLPVASDQNWGAASTQLVHALLDEHVLAIIALDRNAAHLSEQLALKSFVPVVALSGDRTLTSTNVPWIFRLPANTTPAAALRLLLAAAHRSGANPEQLRDVLASGKALDGFAFLPTGEPRVQ